MTEYDASDVLGMLNTNNGVLLERGQDAGPTVVINHAVATGKSHYLMSVSNE